jgi:hypothetical protein
MTRIFLTFLAISTAVSGVIAPASAQESDHFDGVACEIDTTPLNVDYTTNGSKSVLTYDSERLCTGVASSRNVKLTCSAPLPGWKQQRLGNRSASGFPCGIFVNICGLSPSFVHSTVSTLSVTATGVATLQCFLKP